MSNLIDGESESGKILQIRPDPQTRVNTNEHCFGLSWPDLSRASVKKSMDKSFIANMSAKQTHLAKILYNFDQNVGKKRRTLQS